MITDSIGDMLIRIKNGYLVKKTAVIIPYSKFKEELAKLLVREKYLKDYQKTDDRTIQVTLSYKNGSSVITDLKRISKPGLRVYKGKTNLPRVLGGMGSSVISTPGGLMTDKEARKKGLGGEVICKIW